MRFGIDAYKDIVCIQIPLSERQELIDLLKDLKRPGLTVPSDRGVVRFRRSDDEFFADTTDLSNILFSLPDDKLEDLIAAIEEHLLEQRECPLDHPLEPSGARILPMSVKDVVFETR